MKISFKKRSGLTLVEILVVIAILVLLAALLLPTLTKPRYNYSKVNCAYNLKMVGLSFRLYAGDNNNKYPMNVSTNDEPLIIETTPVYRYFLSLANELGTPKILICPQDEERMVANIFTNLNNTNISYFVGLDATEFLPNSILSGDRNITNGLAPQQGLLNLTTNQNVRFTEEIHKKQGNIALGDGSVQQVSNARLRSEFIHHSPFATNRIKLP